MIELTVLGPHLVRGADGREIASLAAQPKRFALLAFLALDTRAGYHRRDTLAALFWPELDQFAARRALRNTLYHLREALGGDVLVVRGDDAIAIDPAALTCDAGRLAASVAAGRFDDAIELYRGELLAGMHIPNVGDAFEEWLSLERRRMRELALRSLQSLVDRAESIGDYAAATRWARRACALTPDDESWLRRTMKLLEQGGDTGGALRAYEQYGTRLSAEFGAMPSAETRELASRLRSGSGQTHRPLSAAAIDSNAAQDDRSLEAPPPARVGLSAGRRHRPKRVLFWLSAAAVVFAAVLVAAAASARHIPADQHRTRVIVAVFDDRTGDPRLHSLGRMTRDWLVRRIVRAHLVDVVEPRAPVTQDPVEPPATDPTELARRTDASLIVSGSVDRAGDSVLVQAVVVDARTSRVMRVIGPITAAARDPVAGIDALGSRVTTALASVVDVHTLPDLQRANEIPPFDAYRAYLDGWDAYWHGDAMAAESLYVRAIGLDSAFTPAIIALAVAAANSNGCSKVDSLAQVLAHSRGAVRTVDRIDDVTMRIADARCRGRNEEMLRLTLERAELEPGDAGAQMSAAAAADWANRPAKMLELLGRVNPDVDLAWSTDTLHIGYWGSMSAAFHMLGRYREELAAADHVPTSTPLTRVWFRGSALAALARPVELLALIDSSLTLPVETVGDIGLAPFTDGRPQYTMTPAWVANWIARELVTHGDTATARQAAMRAVAWYHARPPAERATIEERLVQAWSLEILRQYADAERVTRALVAIDSANIDFRGELAGLAAEQGKFALADSLDRWLAAQDPTRVSWTATLYRARVAALSGRPDDAMARLREAFQLGIWPAWLHEEPAFAPLRTRADFISLTAPRG